MTGETQVEALAENQEEAHKQVQEAIGSGSSYTPNGFSADAWVMTSLVTNETVPMKAIRAGDKVRFHRLNVENFIWSIHKKRAMRLHLRP